MTAAVIAASSKSPVTIKTLGRGRGGAISSAARRSGTAWDAMVSAVGGAGATRKSRLHLRKALIDERTQWLLRIRSVLYHHGLSAGAPARISGPDGRGFLDGLDLPADARERVTVALGMIDTLENEIHEIERSLRRVARHQPGCQALMGQFGIGELIALTLLTELGDVSRMSSSRKAVRFGGLDIGVHRSDQTARVGRLTPRPTAIGYLLEIQHPG